MSIIMSMAWRVSSLVVPVAYRFPPDLGVSPLLPGEDQSRCHPAADASFEGASLAAQHPRRFRHPDPDAHETIRPMRAH